MKWTPNKRTVVFRDFHGGADRCLRVHGINQSLQRAQRIGRAGADRREAVLDFDDVKRVLNDEQAAPERDETRRASEFVLAMVLPQESDLPGAVPQRICEVHGEIILDVRLLGALR